MPNVMQRSGFSYHESKKKLKKNSGKTMKTVYNIYVFLSFLINQNVITCVEIPSVQLVVAKVEVMECDGEFYKNIKPIARNSQ